jgi:DNA-binding NarL/FixJ family response regulator
MSLHVIDDHPVMREAIVLMLRRIRPGAVIHEHDRISAFEAATSSGPAPELICLDLKLPDAEGPQGVTRVRQRWPNAPIVVISASPSSEMEAAALAAGATRYVDKSQPVRLMTAAVRDLLGAPDAEVMPDARNDQEMVSTPDDRPFSKRQVELLVMIDRGESNRDIAEKLGISEHTVKVHLWRLFRRMGVSSRTQATRQARDMGLL